MCFERTIQGKVFAILCAFAVLVAAPPAEGATYKPTRTDDPAPNGCKRTDCSLREAVEAADATPGTPDEIVLKPATTYVLDSRLSPRDTTLTIASGSKRKATIDGQKLPDGVIDFPYRLTLRGLFVRGNPNATTGYGVVTGAEVRIEDSVITGHGGIGVLASKPTIVNSTISHNGGIGVDATSGGLVKGSRILSNGSGGLRLQPAFGQPQAPVVIKDSTIAENSNFFWGGGIVNHGNDMRLIRSTVSGNASSLGGGGIANETLQGGGGSVPHLTIENSTIADNEADGYGGGIDNFRQNGSVPVPETTIRSSTIAYNTADADGDGGELGGGLQNGGAVLKTENSIIAVNSTFSGAAPDCQGGIGSQANNLIGDPTGCVSAPGDLFGMAGLRTFGDYGGPTKTIALKKNSQAINAGTDSTCPKSDQRGVKRDRCDLGSYERR